MKKTSNHMLKYGLVLIVGFLFLSCYRNQETTGWEYNTPGNGGFQKVPFFEQESAPGMVLVDGGSCVLEGDSMTVSSFYISKYEETNGQYLAYLEFLGRYYSHATYTAALPDTTVWKNSGLEESASNDLIKNYFRAPQYADFPVVGLNAIQIKKYAEWKSDRMNEYILVREEVISAERKVRDSSEVFTTEWYFNAQPSGLEEMELVDLDPDNKHRKKGTRIVRMEDGILLPSFRLPTENEWQWAHLAIGNEKNKYVKTSKAGRIKTYDKRGQFTYLEDVERISSKQKDQIMFANPGIKNVYSCSQNNYKIHALNNNVSEMVGDSLADGIIGGGFNNEIADNSAQYDKELVGDFKYHIPSSLQKSTDIDSTKAGLFGFRLAMDRIGAPRFDSW